MKESSLNFFISLEVLSFWFPENRVDLNDKAREYKNRGNGDAFAAINLIFQEHIGVFAGSANHQEHADSDYYNADRHPQVIIF